MAELEVFKCSLCSTFQSLSLRGLSNHVYTVHSKEINFRIICKIKECPIIFTKYNSWYKHILKHHRTEYEAGGDDAAAINMPPNDVPQHGLLVSDDENEDDDNFPDSNGYSSSITDIHEGGGDDSSSSNLSDGGSNSDDDDNENVLNDNLLYDHNVVSLFWFNSRS